MFRNSEKISTCTVEITQYALNQRSPAEGKGKGQKPLAQGLQPVLEPHAKVQLLIFKAKIIKKRKMSKKMMIFYSFPINFSLKILNDLNDRDLNDRTLLGGLKMIMTLNDFDPS